MKKHVLVLLLAGCLRFRPPAPLGDYRVLIEARDSLSDSLARALERRGVDVRREVVGDGRATALLILFTFEDSAPGHRTWLAARLADTRNGAVVAAVSAPLDSLGATATIRAQRLADSLSSRLKARAPIGSP